MAIMASKQALKGTCNDGFGHANEQSQPAMPRYHHPQQPHLKWAIDLDRTTIKVWSGHQGPPDVLHYDNEDEARATYESIIRERLRAGWQNSNEPEEPFALEDAVPHPGHPQLEKALREKPTERDRYLVYADAILEAGDPRGELIMLHDRIRGNMKSPAAQAQTTAFLTKHGAQIFGTRLWDCRDMMPDIEWRHGFVRSCRMCTNLERFNGLREDISVSEALGWLLEAPVGHLLEGLVVGIVRYDQNDYSEICDLLGRSGAPNLQTLYLGDFTYEETELNWSTIGDASRLYSGVPNLRELTLRSGSMILGTIDLPQLRSFTTVTGGLDDDAAKAIACARWPHLETLSVQYGRGSQDACTDLSSVDPILMGTLLPSLRHLGITNCEFTDELCLALPRAAILPRLSELDLSMGTMTEIGAQSLIDHRSAFAHLDKLIVEDNYLPPEIETPLQDICKNVVFGEQRDDEGDPDNRYASAFE